MGLTSTTAPSVSGLCGDGGIPSMENIIYSFPMAASSSVSKGDFVKLASTSAGTIQKCSATDDTVIGIANVSIDNTYGQDGVTAGAAGEKLCPVIVKGITYVDALVASTGDWSLLVAFNDPLYLTSATLETASVAQKLSATSGTDGGTTKIARSLDAIAVPTADTTYKVRVYVNFLDKALA